MGLRSPIHTLARRLINPFNAKATLQAIFPPCLSNLTSTHRFSV